MSALPIAIVGTGPAALMAGHELVAQGHAVRFFEKKRGPGRKFLIAGSSGLNITYDAPIDEFLRNYSGPPERFERFLSEFPPQAWIGFIESLGIKTFKGTSRRYFVEGLKASTLLRAWITGLESRGAGFEYGAELLDFESTGERVLLRFGGSGEGGIREVEVKAALLALGGGSWEHSETPLRWPEILGRKKLKFHPFQSSNAGFQVDWPAKLLEEAEGLPIKNVVLHSARGTRSGDPVITKYGMEGTPVYFAGDLGLNHLDLKPDLSREALLKRLGSTRENLSPMRRVKKLLGLGEGALALVFHLTPRSELESLEKLVDRIKRFPIVFRARQPLTESISSSGGLDWSEVDREMMLLRHPGVFVAGEMLDWDAPTGGFLIQASVSQGFAAGRGMARLLARSP